MMSFGFFCLYRFSLIVGPGCFVNFKIVSAITYVAILCDELWLRPTELHLPPPAKQSQVARSSLCRAATPPRNRACAEYRRCFPISAALAQPARDAAANLHYEWQALARENDPAGYLSRNEALIHSFLPILRKQQREMAQQVCFRVRHGAQEWPPHMRSLQRDGAETHVGGKSGDPEVAGTATLTCTIHLSQLVPLEAGKGRSLASPQVWLIRIILTLTIKNKTNKILFLILLKIAATPKLTFLPWQSFYSVPIVLSLPWTWPITSPVLVFALD